MLSMTGFGRGESKEGGIELSVEVKTVNNRYLDASIKCPRIFNAYEDLIRNILREKLTRGHADVFVNFSDKREKQRSLYLDEGTAKAYADAARKIQKLFPDAQNDFSVSGILRFPDVIKTDDISSADDECVAALKAALAAALDKLNAMRKVEGEKLKADMLARMDTIESLVSKVEKRAPLVAEGYRTKLEAKIKKILDGVEVDEGRILTEAALFADKSNIDEELTRLHSHIAQFREICKEELVGRKLDFLVQEFNRETNTICSKSNDIEITRLGLLLKNEIEKIREQVQNVE
ncbi:MAG: YicC family protein [Clostridia bacterium]|nr:YicC family protein [Clostridia bacterium]